VGWPTFADDGHEISMTEKTKGQVPETLQNLLFRRQFLLGPEQFTPNQYWSCIQLPHGFILSVHHNLPFTTESYSDVTVTLIGLAIDPFYPEFNESEILHSLISNASDLPSLIDSTMPLAGRWIIIYQNTEGTYLFTDPCGFRQVFYYSDGKHVWCASQPELINANHKLFFSTDDTLFRFLMNPEFARAESAWVGTRTIYENCFHVLPNHYLNVCRLEQIRFYPTRTIPRRETSEIIEAAASILRGTMTAIVKRQNAIMALTAGRDTRVLLAASKDVSENIEYYIDRHGVLPEDHPDVWVPQRLADKLNIKFIVKNSFDNLPGWFVSMLSTNVTGARVLPKTRMIYNKFATGENRININGNASGICKNHFDKYCKRDPKDISSDDLVRLFGYNSMPLFVMQEISEWRKSLDTSMKA
jgi:hypothetical protein